jgi:hypothetical protein
MDVQEDVFKVVDQKGDIFGFCSKDVKSELESIGLLVTPIFVWKNKYDVRQEFRDAILEKEKSARKDEISKLATLAAQFAELKAHLGELSPAEQRLVDNALTQPLYSDDDIPF